MRKPLLHTFIVVSAFWISTTFSLQANTDPDPLELAKQNIEQIRKGPISIEIKDAQGRPLDNLSVRIEQQTHHFTFGSIIFELTHEDFLTPEQTAGYKEKFANLFNLAVFPFYWEGYEANPGHPTWQKTEELIEWCLSEGIRPKGHPLAWTHPAGTPPWFYDLPADLRTGLLKSRIVRNVHGYKGSIDIWDVVNEAVNTIPWEKALKEPKRKNNKRYSGNRYSIEVIADWVAPCYEWARASNKDAELILNDYGQIADPRNRKRFYDLVKTLQTRDTPLDGIGLQAHEPRLEWYSPEDVWETFELYKELDLPIHITEFHPHSAGAKIKGGFKKGNWTQETQAAYGEQMFTLAFGHPSVASISWWDFTENDSYIKGSALLNKDLSPKPAYVTLDRLINHEWKTREQIQTNTEGHVSFRGFYGDYSVWITKANGQVEEFNFSHTPESPSSWDIQL